MPTKTAPADAEPTAENERAAQPVHADVRRADLYVLSRKPWLAAFGRAGSIATLAALDAVGLALGIYIALVVREIVYAHATIYWSLLWDGPKEWLRFIIPITLIVFWQAGLYGPRERRPGPGRIVSSLILVAAIVLAFGLGTGHEFSTTGLVPTATVTAALVIVVLRSAYESISLELLRVAGVRRRAILVGEGRVSRICTARSARPVAESTMRSWAQSRIRRLRVCRCSAVSLTWARSSSGRRPTS